MLALILFTSLSGVAGSLDVRSSSVLDERDAGRVMRGLISGEPEWTQHSLDEILAAGDERFIPVLIELMRFHAFAIDRDIHLAALQQLSGQDLPWYWPGWVEWYGMTEIAPPPGFMEWKGRLFSRIDDDFARFFDPRQPATIRYEEIVWGGVPVDGIPSLDDPPLLSADAADYLDDDAPVFGVTINGESRAYPLRIMDQHEMSNDVLGGEPIAVAYCTLCGAAIAYSRIGPDGTVFTFGSSGLLHRSNKLMFDRQTYSLWNHLTGEPVAGPLADDGIDLDYFPIVLTTWGDWRAEHPDTTVLDIETGFARQYLPGDPYGEYFNSSSTMFPVARRDEELDAKAQVFALELDGRPKAYPLEVFVDEPVINDAIGRQPVVLLSSGEIVEVEAETREGGLIRYTAGGDVRAYQRGSYRFERFDRDVLLDAAGGAWQVTEEALIGPDGERLERLPGHLVLWFGWYAFYPETEVYGE